MKPRLKKEITRIGLHGVITWPLTPVKLSDSWSTVIQSIPAIDSQAPWTELLPPAFPTVDCNPLNVSKSKCFHSRLCSQQWKSNCVNNITYAKIHIFPFPLDWSIPRCPFSSLQLTKTLYYFWKLLKTKRVLLAFSMYLSSQANGVNTSRM